ncbi:MAG: DNA polymerase III subunit delta, partial [Ruminococcus sp.]|nr:DNA polymerase III subunit delta [Ruminococcus sp.]
MAQTDAKTIKSQLKKGELSNLYYLFGADVNGTESLTKAIIKSAVGDNEDFSLTKLRGNSLDISQLRDTIEMMPMMSEYNCILINDYNCEEHKEEEVKQLID